MSCVCKQASPRQSTAEKRNQNDDCRLLIVNLRCELENERLCQASPLPKSKINIRQSSIHSWRTGTPVSQVNAEPIKLIT
jgi:hypothetical protein